jgi:hypothetical protein
VQVFGGPQAAGLDLALDVFGTLSVTMEDLPKDGAAAPVDDASDQIILPVRFSFANKHNQPGVAVVDHTLRWQTREWILIHQSAVLQAAGSRRGSYNNNYSSLAPSELPRPAPYNVSILVWLLMHPLPYPADMA